MRCDACRGVVDEQKSTKYTAQQVKILEASQKIMKVQGLQLPQAHLPDSTMMTDLLNAAVFGVSPEDAGKSGIRSNMQGVWGRYLPKQEKIDKTEFFVCPTCANKLDALANWKRIACPKCSRQTIRAGVSGRAVFAALCPSSLGVLGIFVLGMSKNVPRWAFLTVIGLILTCPLAMVIAFRVGRMPTTCQYCSHTWRT